MAKSENKPSMKGMDNRKGGSGSVKKEEGMVGGSGRNRGVHFKMPEGCVDHSKVRGSIGKE